MNESPMAIEARGVVRTQTTRLLPLIFQMAREELARLWRTLR